MHLRDIFKKECRILNAAIELRLLLAHLENKVQHISLSKNENYNGQTVITKDKREKTLGAKVESSGMTVFMFN